jgi:diacylglycerol kinase (ATP)
MRRFLRSFVYAFRGIAVAMRQRNLRIQTSIALVVVAGGFYFDISRLEWLFVIVCIALVMGLEMMNSAVEALVDLVSPEYKRLAGKVKDIAAGAVLLAAVIAAIVGLVVFVPYLRGLLPE